MKKHLFIVLTALLLCSFSLYKWDLMGGKVILLNEDHGVIDQFVYKKPVDAFKLKVAWKMVKMQKMTVSFQGGGTQDVDLTNDFKNGESSTIDIVGADHVVVKVEFWCESQQGSKKKAHVQFWGKH